MTKDMTLCDKHRQRHCELEDRRDNSAAGISCCNKSCTNCCNCRSTRPQHPPDRHSSFRIQSLFRKNKLYIMEEGEFQMDEATGEFYVSADVKAAFDKLG